MFSLLKWRPLSSYTLRETSQEGRTADATSLRVRDGAVSPSPIILRSLFISVLCSLLTWPQPAELRARPTLSWWSSGRARSPIPPLLRTRTVGGQGTVWTLSNGDPFSIWRQKQVEKKTQLFVFWLIALRVCGRNELIFAHEKLLRFFFCNRRKQKFSHGFELGMHATMA